MSKAKFRFPREVLKPVVEYLRDKKKKLSEEKRELREEDPFADNNRSSDNASDADAVKQFGHARVEALSKEVDGMLIRVKKALTKLRSGEWGVCESCGKMINTDRLAIDPTVGMCVKCSQKGSRGKK